MDSLEVSIHDKVTQVARTKLCPFLKKTISYELGGRHYTEEVLAPCNPECVGLMYSSITNDWGCARLVDIQYNTPKLCIYKVDEE